MDRLSSSERVHAGRLPPLVDVPVILTVRRPDDGGMFEGDERERLALLRRCAGDGFAYVDLEEGLEAPALEASLKEAGTRTIRSLHDLTGVPSDFGLRLDRISQRPDEIPKAAVTPRSSADLARVLRVIMDRRGKSPDAGGSQMLVLGMGAIGFPTRVLASKLGAAWCYASPASDMAAPGHVDPATLEDLYRFRSIGPDTAVFGVMGDPVMHSRSPFIHNRGFDACGLDAVFLPFHVPDLEGFWQVADLLGVRGLSVTVPHKGAVLRRLSGSDALVRATGACNTMTRAEAPGGWQGTNTDVAGFAGPLRDAFGGTVPRGLAATVIGAGGAARSVVHALSGFGGRILVLNRTPDHARAVAEPAGASFGGLDEAGFKAARKFADLVVQTTKVGMDPAADRDPAPDLSFSGMEIVYELIYAPRVTPFLGRALKAGCKVIYGKQMLISQAMEQFRLFSGRPYPFESLTGLEEGID